MRSRIRRTSWARWTTLNDLKKNNTYVSSERLRCPRCSIKQQRGDQQTPHSPLAHLGRLPVCNGVTELQSNVRPKTTGGRWGLAHDTCVLGPGRRELATNLDSCSGLGQRFRGVAGVLCRTDSSQAGLEKQGGSSLDNWTRRMQHDFSSAAAWRTPPLDVEHRVRGSSERWVPAEGLTLEEGNVGVGMTRTPRTDQKCLREILTK